MLSGGEVFKARKRIGPGSPRPGSFCVQAGRPGKLQPSSAESPPTVPLLSPQVTSPYTITPASSLHPPRRAHPPRASHPAHPIPASAPPCTPRPLPTYSTLHPASGGQWSGSIAELLCHRVLRGFRTLRHREGDDGLYAPPISIVCCRLNSSDPPPPWPAFAMSADGPAPPPPPPPSPSSARERYAPPTALSPRERPREQDPNWRSPYSSLALKCAHLPNSSVNAACGAVAGIASGIVTCPLDVIKTRLQAQGSWRPRHQGRASRVVYQGLLGTARVIWSQDGVRGMYRGLGPMLLGYVPTWAVYMSVYDWSKDFFYTRMGLSLEQVLWNCC